ncbi:hypothetical protein SBRY_50395 [Actinacidiphila bryophytorum]|uniref:Uncharacterized protein n=1 Tax=Actinacidiphila bryophytorum TaxID=1436133 RepID=A0A9W4MES1_9ACTN|nr:hypothetical protein SBRY_50395 [Actinacidiphila bryophytorum]
MRQLRRRGRTAQCGEREFLCERCGARPRGARSAALGAARAPGRHARGARSRPRGAVGGDRYVERRGGHRDRRGSRAAAERRDALPAFHAGRAYSPYLFLSHSLPICGKSRPHYRVIVTRRVCTQFPLQSVVVVQETDIRRYRKGGK